MAFQQREIDPKTKALILNALVGAKFELCRYCNKVEVSWNDPARAMRGIKGPITQAGEPHSCDEYKQARPQTTSGKTYYSAPNPSGYTGDSKDYQSSSSGSRQPLPQSDLEIIKSQILELKATQNEMYDLIQNFIKDNPIHRAQLDFQAKMFPVFAKYFGKGSSMDDDDDFSDFITADNLPKYKTEINKEKSTENNDDDFVDSKKDF